MNKSVERLRDKMSDINPPCDCIEKSGEYWVQQCYCHNSGDLANAESWCTKQNMVEPLRAEIAALKAENKSLKYVIENAHDVLEKLPELNMLNYDEDEVEELNAGMINVYYILDADIDRRKALINLSEQPTNNQENG